MPHLFAFQVDCHEIFLLRRAERAGQKLVATCYKKFGFFKLVEHSTASFRYATRLNSLQPHFFWRCAKIFSFDFEHGSFFSDKIDQMVTNQWHPLPES
jgi:hypothetical protein